MAQKPSQRGPRRRAHPPQVDGFKLKGKLDEGQAQGSGASLLRSISFLEIAPEKDVLNVIYVESRDIDKNPYLFSIIKIRRTKWRCSTPSPPR